MGFPSVHGSRKGGALLSPVLIGKRKLLAAGV